MLYVDRIFTHGCAVDKGWTTDSGQSLFYKLGISFIDMKSKSSFIK